MWQDFQILLLLLQPVGGGACTYHFVQTQENGRENGARAVASLSRTF
jgi:hypothetical protein